MKVQGQHYPREGLPATIFLAPLWWTRIGAKKIVPSSARMGQVNCVKRALFASCKQAWRAAAAELAALLALCAVSNNDRVGLIAFTDEVERFVPPNKGPRHVLRLLRDILAFEPHRPGTDLSVALDYLNKVQRRRAIVFLLSDFLSSGFEHAFRRAARKHDLIAVRTADPREQDWPAAGLVRLEDAETGKKFTIDT